MADQEARFAIELDVKGKQESESLADALTRLRNQLKADQAAVTELQEAMRRLKQVNEVSQFVKLTSELSKQTQTLKASRASLAALNAQMAQMQGGASMNITAFRGLQEKIDKAKAAVAGGEEKIASLQKHLDELGKTDAVKGYKELQATLASKKQALGAAQLDLMKLGQHGVQAAEGAKVASHGVKQLAEGAKVASSGVGQLANGAKAAGGGLDELLSSAQSSGGPLGQLAGIGGRLKGVLGKAGAAGAALLLAAAIAAVIVGTVAAVVSLTRFALAAADAARSQHLLLDAATGGRVAADALTAQIDAVAGRVAMLRGPLEELALALSRSGLEGRALEAALSAVATTSTVMGQAAGSALQGIADRARQARRFVLGAFDLQGTGLKIADVAMALSKRLNVSFAAAQAAIQNGTVRVEDGLEALDAAVQAKFGKIAKAQLLAFNVQVQKAHENVGRIFAGVNVEKFLEALHDVLSVLDQSTITGRALRALAETALNPLFDNLAKLGPMAKAFFQGMVIAALLVAVSVLKVRNAFRDAFGSDIASNIDWIKTAMYAGAGAVGAFVAIVGLLAAALALVVGPFVAIAYGAYKAYNALLGIPWGSAGSFIVDGLVSGITGRIGRVIAAVKGLGQSAMATFKSTLGIASPSKVFDEFGGYTAEGFARGVEGGSARVDDAVGSMVGVPSQPSGGTRSADANSKSGGNTYNFYISGVKGAEELKEPSFLARLTEALEGAALQAAMPLGPEKS
jgi:X-X-X-Leu-X-X-Gly heptad repeat protein